MKNMHLYKSTTNILLVVRWPVGGIRTFFRYVYHDFDPLRWRFTLLAPDLPEVRYLLKDLAHLDLKFIPIRDMPQDGRSGAGRMIGKVFAVIRHGEFDLVHSHGFISGVCTAIPAHFGRLPHIMTSHDVILPWQFFGIGGKVKCIGMGLAMRLVSIIHAVSNDAQENLYQYFPFLNNRSKKCIVIPNGIEIERFENAVPINFRKKLGIPNDTFLIGFMGRFMEQKGFKYLLDAIEYLVGDDNIMSNRKPLVLAIGNGGYLTDEIRNVKNRGLEKHFVFLPFTPNIAGAIKGMDVVVMPSLWEACGLLAMETLICGTPLIGSNCMGLREVMSGTPAVAVRPKDGVALATALAEEMEKPKRGIFSSYALTASKRFDVRRQSQEVKKLYLSICHRNS